MVDVDAENLTKLLPLNEGVKIISVHPSGLVAFEKAHKLMTHPNKEGDQNKSMLVAPYDLNEECYTLDESIDGIDKLYILNRIDSPTSGLVLGALNEEIAQVVRALFKQAKVSKTYYAIVKGGPVTSPATWTDTLKKTNRSGKLRVQSGLSVTARTLMQWLKHDVNNLGLSLLKLKPLTGRTHQLRIQCSKRGCPILGDRTYGDFEFNRYIAKLTEQRRMFLHAAELKFSFEWEGQKHSFKVNSPVPESFALLLNLNNNIRKKML